MEVPSGLPTKAAFVETSTRQLLFNTSFDQAYTIKLTYVQEPTLIDSDSTTLTCPNKVYTLLLMKFKEIVADTLGDANASMLWNSKYKDYLNNQLGNLKHHGSISLEYDPFK